MLCLLIKTIHHILGLYKVGERGMGKYLITPLPGYILLQNGTVFRISFIFYEYVFFQMMVLTIRDTFSVIKLTLQTKFRV